LKNKKTCKKGWLVVPGEDWRKVTIRASRRVAGLPSLKKGEKICVEDVHGSLCVSGVNHARYVDLAGA